MVRATRAPDRGAGLRGIAAALTAGLCLTALPVAADLVFDGSLGPAGALAGDMVVEQAFGRLSADGGNLFHSFERLSVESGESLHFATDDLTVQNIIGRVTGFEASFLDGPVSADANLFVINPNGVILGAGASFDPSVVIEFAAADTVFFDDGSVFRVRDTDAAATLSIASPDAFGFVSIATDDSLAPAQVLVDAEDGTAFIDADAGQTAGPNLFLSFSAFSLYPEQQALFLTDPGTAHVVARVSSLEDSLINGALTILDATTFDVSPAEFWLANPNGLLFGSGAVLDGVTSLHAGAATAVAFDDGSFFAADPGAGDVLGVAAPTGFDVTGAAGDVRLRGAFLGTRDRLTFSGPRVSVAGSALGAPVIGLFAPSAGVVDVSDPEATPLGGSERGRVDVTASRLAADVFRPGQGRDDPRLAIVGGRLVELRDADLGADSGGTALGRVRIRGGDVDIDGTFVSANTQSDVPDERPELRISAEGTLRLVDSVIEADTTGASDAGDILLVGTDVELSGGTVFAESFGGAQGDAGNITLRGERVGIADDSLLASRALAGRGDAGSVVLLADEAVSIESGSALETSSIGTGDAGLIQIAAPDIVVDSASLSSSSASPADAAFLLEEALPVFNDAFGTTIDVATSAEFVAAITPVLEAELAIDIEATDTAGLVNEILQEAETEALETFLEVLPFGLGDLASIRDAPPGASEVGSAGAIRLAGSTIDVTTSNLSTITASTGLAAPSLIALSADTALTLTDSILESDTRGVAPAGNVSLQAPALTLSGTIVFAESFDGGSGDAGNISLTGSSILVEDGSFVASRALTGAGDAGTATLSATASLTVRDSGIETSAIGVGDAGRVLLEAPTVALEGAEVESSSTLGPMGATAGEAGTIDVFGDVVTARDSTLATVTGATTPGDPASISLGATELLEILDSAVRADTSGPSPAGAALLSGGAIVVRGSDVQALSIDGATGDAGIVQLTGSSILVTDDSRLGSRVFSDGGDAGGVFVASEGAVTISGGASVETSAVGSGDAGVIDIAAGTLLVEDANLESTSEADPASADVGSAGAIVIIVDSARFDRATLSTLTQSTDELDGSVIIVESAGALDIVDSTLESDTFGVADAGAVALVGRDVTILGSQIFAESLAPATGDAGDILVQGERAHVGAGSTVASRALAGTGDAGTATLTASESLLVDGDASVETSSAGEGDAGFIALTEPLLTLETATLRSTSEAPFDPSLGLAEAIDAFNAALGTDIREDTPAGFIAAITPLYEAALGIDVESTTPAAFVDEVFEEADFEQLAAFQAQLPFELFDIAGLTAAERGTSDVGDAGSITLLADVVELRDATLSTTTSATERGTPSDVTITAAERITATGVLIEADTFGISSAGSIALSAPTIDIDGTIASRAVGDAVTPRGVFELGAALGVEAAGGSVRDFLADVVAALETRLGIDIESETGVGIVDEVLDEADPVSLTDLLADLEDADADLFVLDDLDGRGGRTEIGSAGDITVSGTDITLTSADLTTTSEATVDGRPASIDVQATGALVADDAVLTASTRALAPAGDIALGGASIALTDSTVTAESQVGARGDAGSLTLRADTTIDLAGTEVTSRSLSAQGEAGSITVLAGDGVTLRAGNRPTTLTTSSEGAGRAGDILVDAATLTMLEDSEILSESLGTSISGGVLLQLGTRLDMFDSAISTNSLRARGGDIVIITRGSEVFLTRSTLEASAGAEGSGGNILLDTEFLVLEDSSILATAVAGNGGQIDIFSDAVVQDFFTTISADSETGNSGTVNISAPDNDMNAVVIAQDASHLVVPELVSDRCAPGAEAGSRLIVRPSTPVRSLPESPRSVAEVEGRLELSGVASPDLLGAPCSVEGGP